MTSFFQFAYKPICFNTRTKHKKDIESFGKKTKKFISAIVDANNTLSSSNLNQQSITLFGYAVQAGQQISQLANEMPKSGGIWQKIVGEKDLADFGEKIKTYGEALVDFSNKISGISGNNKRGGKTQGLSGRDLNKKNMKEKQFRIFYESELLFSVIQKISSGIFLSVIM